jgi:hypothetical protein
LNGEVRSTDTGTMHCLADLIAGSVPSQLGVIAYVISSDFCIKISYDVMGEPLSKGAVHVIKILVPLTEVTGAIGGSGV